MSKHVLTIKFLFLSAPYMEALSSNYTLSTVNSIHTHYTHMLYEKIADADLFLKKSLVKCQLCFDSKPKIIVFGNTPTVCSNL